MKQILFRIRQFPHLSETFVLAQMITAKKAGFEVTILIDELLSFQESTHEETILKHQFDKRIVFEDYRIQSNKFIRLFKAAFILLKHFKNIKKLIKFLSLKKKFSLTWIYQFNFYKKFENFDVYHIQYGTSSKPFDILKKAGLLKGKLIVSFHGHDAFFPINGFIPNNGYYKHLFQGDNLIVANTPYLAGIIRSLGCPDKNLRVVPVGVDTHYFMPTDSKKSSDRLRLITVGRLDPIKGHEFAIEAVNKIKNKGYKIKLLIIGEGDHRELLENKIQNLQLEEDIQLLGRRNQEAVKYYLQQSDVFLFTSVPLKDGRRETQGLATLEAQACGLPVVAFNSGGIKYTFRNGENGFLCKEFDVDCLVKNIELLFEKKIRIEMGKRSRVNVQKFSLKNIEYQWAQIYNEL
ncbi:glycosyltransferase family 4 protein [Autumnicola psychrophila]|uniref:Glycosyltransferase family 4 protein n=1 Tax=Autumnicola psychrophila TaxID=3075592 RepID=A0ABU3DT14_9FLAO|nr:glycosyltransferase family 4 protein [Zunongwangia sp. F225]MDT0686856.1 glycosyltransferase family 4 protein [Zunongwangia sp. F225]